MAERRTKIQTPVQKFPLEQLRANSLKLFDVSSFVFDGATHGLKGEFTVQEIGDTIKKWKEKEVK